jgi:predicted DNA-binding transcriptional regulator AlpA
MAQKLKRELLSGIGVLDVSGGITPTRLLRFRDLQILGIVDNWPTLLRWINEEGFPAGFRLGPNTRAFPDDEVARWLESRRISGHEHQAR